MGPPFYIVGLSRTEIYLSGQLIETFQPNKKKKTRSDQQLIARGLLIAVQLTAVSRQSAFLPPCH